MPAALQAAGHEGARQDAGLFIKPTTCQEVQFYQWIVNQSCELASMVPLFMGTLTEQSSENKEEPAADLNNGAESESKPLIVLEDLCQGFDVPSIIDIKLGSQLWDENASPEKRARLDEVSRSTTSGSLGFRIAGMTVINEHQERETFGKMFGRQATAATIDDYLLKFWPQLKTNDYIYNALLATTAELERLYSALSQEFLELRSASVLIIYEGDMASFKNKAEKEGLVTAEVDESMKNEYTDEETDSDDEQELKTDGKLVDVRLIDFAHTKCSSKPDTDVLKGLKELISSFKRLQKLAENSI